jgi:predicted AlkP superfamily phosphohydrolase/phosphomutase/tetratricopeptide (TPR) repeat protein
MPDRLAKKVLLIGWDAADWKIIHPLMDQGLMPTLGKMVDEGVIGNLATLQPILSPMLWTSIATGMRADKHGILGFTEPDPTTGAVRPTSSSTRKVKAVWNILTQRGLRAHVVGWFAGHPAEPINGVCVSPFFAHHAVDKEGQVKPFPDGVVHPAALAPTLAPLRIHPGEIDGQEILPLVPRAAEVDQKKDRKILAIASNLAQTVSIHNAATWILRHQEWDFLAVYYNAIDHFCHGFMNFHPPRQEHIDEHEFEIYKDVVAGAYRFHDMLLETLLVMAGEDTTVILVSDHGFHSDHLRPRGIPKEPAGPAICHRPIGILAMRGPHIRRDERIYGANLLDVTPTVLSLFGLPAGKDMDGKVLASAFDAPPPLDRIASWEQEPGECGMHPADQRMDAEAAKAVLDQFVALGYIEPPDENRGKALASAVRETKYNLARVYMDARRPQEALPLFEELAKENPDETRFAQHLAECLLALGRREESRRVLEVLVEKGTERPRQDLLLGVIHFGADQPEQALEYLLKAEQADPRLPGLHIRIGNVYLRRRRWEDAERAFRKAIDIDGDSAHAHLGLAASLVRLKRNQEAATAALEAVGLEHHLPLGHYWLGVALARMANLQRAALAFEMALSMAPGLAAAHRWLASIHRFPGGDAEKAEFHRSKAAELRRKRGVRKS